jgi:hypothetical protein
MNKGLLSLAALASLMLAGSATALPRSLPAFELQMDIRKEGLEMIIDGATDEEEQAMLVQRLAGYGWTQECDLDDLNLYCAFYKQGYIYAVSQ